ncbi:hypothetical protein RO3G_04294 [Rhizopus delemar RA 99-880]|uniref:Uncharacterized protein n=1 Tax=Rhizopus delemar (strain RA 99-880 / ATCC MYA-4621 / FGSC 9543 / NRRL 43880) TaxID=246409 RepID=I1BTQ9_RHIO9|nr:hypothetical protein RO3G_04294 [Rhizopus delemar RA 99-880]|eukprot:EIE79589.1 hypothetical protein RO3G_04294 [Rhizopus delemar RA 99-880]
MFQKCFDRGVTLDGKLEKKISKIEEVFAIKIKMNLLLLITIYFRSRKKKFRKAAPFASSMKQRPKAQWSWTSSVSIPNIWSFSSFTATYLTRMLI